MASETGLPRGSEPSPAPLPREATGAAASMAPNAEPLADLILPERPSTMDETGRRRWVYPATVHGPFLRYRRLVSYILIAILFAMPWIRINSMPAILLQIPERRFILFGHVFWPQDSFYLVPLLLGLALTLFFFTAIAGRVWCGWACPQTVFMEGVFRRIEEWIEGDHHERRRLDTAPLSVSKATKKALKHGVFLLLSALVSNTFLAYFVGTDRLLRWITGAPADHWTAFLIMAVTLGVFYFDFAWFREQFCTVVCPYARFQAVLTDSDTFQVGYDTARGEPRGKLGTAAGDCIDCHRCVVVCPTAIDIRQGFQLECIGCARCIDACDEIMDRVRKPRGLIRYDSLSRLQGKRGAIVRPRTVIYSMLLVGVITTLIVALEVRANLDLTVVRPPGDPFAVLPGEIVSNHFQMHLLNRGDEEGHYRLTVAGPPGAQLITAVNPVTIAGGAEAKVEAFVNVPRDKVPGGKAPIEVQVYQGDALVAEQSSTLLGPVAR